MSSMVQKPTARAAISAAPRDVASTEAGRFTTAFSISAISCARKLLLEAISGSDIKEKEMSERSRSLKINMIINANSMTNLNIMAKL